MIHAAPIPPITALLLLISQVGLTKQNKTAALEEFSVLLIRIFTFQKQVNCDGKGGCLRNIYQGLRFVSGEECCVTIQRTTAKEAYRVLPRQMYRKQTSSRQIHEPRSGRTSSSLIRLD